MLQSNDGHNDNEFIGNTETSIRAWREYSDDENDNSYGQSSMDTFGEGSVLSSEGRNMLHDNDNS